MKDKVIFLIVSNDSICIKILYSTSPLYMYSYFLHGIIVALAWACGQSGEPEIWVRKYEEYIKKASYKSYIIDF